jgi:hypothetical protein
LALPLRHGRPLKVRYATSAQGGQTQPTLNRARRLVGDESVHDLGDAGSAQVKATWRLPWFMDANRTLMHRP